MGCGSSKGIAPAAPSADVSPLKDNKSNGTAPQPDAAALHKQRLEQQHQDSTKPQHSQQQDLCVPGRIESTTAPAPPALKTLPEVHDLPPVRGGPAPAAADAEFDYNNELQRGAALGTPGGSQQPSTAQGVAGGLLSKQPDWLRGINTDAPAGPAKLPALTPAQPLTPVAKPGALSSLPPLVGRGLGAPGPGSSSLPALAPAGGRVLTPLGSQNKAGAGGDGAAREEAQVPDSNHGTEKDKQAHKHSAASSRSSSSSSSKSSSRSNSKSPEARGGAPAHAQEPAGPAYAAAPGRHAAGTAADPWDTLQSQYAHAGGSPSPDSSMAGSPPLASKPEAQAIASALPPLHGRAAAAAAPAAPGIAGPAAAAGVARVTGTQREHTASRDIVLDDSNEEAAAADHGQQHQGQARVLAAAGANKSSFGSSTGGKLSAQSSQHSVSSSMPHVAKSGGWGAGSLAGAGTIMLGDESSSSRVPARKPRPVAAAAGHDDVFSDDEAPVLPRGFGANAAGLAAEASSSSNLRGSRSLGATAAAGGAQQETLDVEEIEDDVDALIESEMARNGLPADLAAKLAQFDANGADGDSEEGGDSPTIFAMMNNRQGSWRAS